MTENDIIRNVEMEVEVIASCISDGNIYVALSSLLSEDLFTDYDTRAVYNIMREIEQGERLVELTLVGTMMAQKGIGLARFILDHAASFEVTRQQVYGLQSLARKRRIYELCWQGITIATTPTADEEDFNDIMKRFEQMEKRDDNEVLTYADSCKDVVDHAAEMKNGRVEAGIRTGLRIFDKRNGFHGGDLVIFAGCTSNGKSSLATTIARNVAMQNIPVAYYSLEMGARQLTARMLSQGTKIPSSRILYNCLSDDDFSRLYNVAMDQSHLPIFYDERSKTSFQKVCSSIRTLAKRKGVRVVFIDYLQILVNGSKSENREQMLGDMARDLKRLAVDTNVCVVALSQLSRDPNSRYGEPSLSRMRGSGQIEEACDMAVLIWRPELYGMERYKDNTSTLNTAMLKLAKGRNVGIGSDIVLFDADLTYFHDGEREQFCNKEKLPF